MKKIKKVTRIRPADMIKANDITRVRRMGAKELVDAYRDSFIMAWEPNGKRKLAHLYEGEILRRL